MYTIQRLLAEVVTPELVIEKSKNIADNHLLLGLTKEMVEGVSFTLDKAITMVSDNVRSVTQFYQLLTYYINNCTTSLQVVVADPLGVIPFEHFKSAHRFSDTLSATEGMQIIFENLKERIANPGDYKSSIIIIPDIQILGQSLNVTDAQFRELILEGPKYGVIPIFIGQYKDLISSYSNLVTLHKQLTTQVFMGMRMTDQDYIRFPYISNEIVPNSNEGYVVSPEGYEFVQLLEI